MGQRMKYMEILKQSRYICGVLMHTDSNGEHLVLLLETSSRISRSAGRLY